MISASDLHIHRIFRRMMTLYLFHAWVTLRLQRSLEDLEGVLAVALEALLSSLPVDDLPDVVHVGSFAVEILSEPYC